MDFVMSVTDSYKANEKNSLKLINGEKSLTWRGNGNVFSDS